MTLASTLVADVRATLIDAAKVTWSDADLLSHLNDSVAMVCGVYLDLYVVVENAHALSVGVRQSLPSDGVVLIDITHNGLGSGVTQQSVAELARVQSGWAAATGTTDVRAYLYDRRSPLTFLVYPPAAAGATVALTYGAIPAAVAANESIPLPDWTLRSLWALMLSKAYAKNTQRQDLTKSAQFQALGLSVLDKWAEAKGRTGAQIDLPGEH